MKMKHLVTAALLAGLVWTAAPARCADEAIDFAKARQLMKKERDGEKLTAEEQAYLDRAKAEHAKGGGGQKPGQGQGRAAANVAPRESTGLVPLTELTEKYKGQDGGLYGGGKNEPPAEHLKRALEAAKQVQPLDAAGKPSAEGKIVLVSMGMSNTTNEFSVFQRSAMKDAEKNPRVVVVDAAQGGMDASQWVKEQSRERVWQQADQRITQAKATPQQVQVIWLKQALASPAQYGEFPASANALRDDIIKALNLAKERYPNLRIAYLSSRIYAGYAQVPLNPEPFAYEGAFAVREVIQKQIAGDAALMCDPAKGAVKSPVVLWGPYLWADGTKGRKIDDLVWKVEDLSPRDGTHPAETGREKVANLLTKFFKTDATAKTWYLK